MRAESDAELIDRVQHYYHLAYRILDVRTGQGGWTSDELASLVQALILADAIREHKEN